MRLWYLSHRRPAKAQASLRIRAVSPEPSLFTHMNFGSRRSVRLKIRHLAPLDVQKVPKSHELAQPIVAKVLTPLWRLILYRRYKVKHKHDLLVAYANLYFQIILSSNYLLTLCLKGYIIICEVCSLRINWFNVVKNAKRAYDFMFLLPCKT